MKNLKLFTLFIIFSLASINYAFSEDNTAIDEQFVTKTEDAQTPKTEGKKGDPKVIVDNYKGGSIKEVKMLKYSDTDDTISFIVNKPSIAEVKILNLPYRLFVDFPMPYRWKVDEEELSKMPVSVVQGFRYSNPSEEIFRVTVDLTRSSYLRRAYVKEVAGSSFHEGNFYNANAQYAKNEYKEPEKDYEFNVDISGSSRGGVSTLAGANSIIFSNDKAILQEISDISNKVDEKDRKSTRGKALEIKIKNHLEEVKYKAPKISDLSRPVRVFIDAGHGGRDPGATSKDKSIQEKDLVLKISKEIKNQLEKNKEISVILSRTDDYYLPLSDRVLWAQHLGAQIFVSIHADNTSSNSQASGMSLYILSEAASDIQTQTLANSENQSDLVAGINLNNDDTEVNNILLSLSQRVKSNESIGLAKSIVDQASKTTKVMPNPIRSAGFAVLKLPSTPSVLIELGFLSNKEDVAQFKKETYPQKIAVTLSAGIEYYLWKKGELSSFPTEVTSNLNYYVDKDIEKAVNKTKPKEEEKEIKKPKAEDKTPDSKAEVPKEAPKK